MVIIDQENIMFIYAARDQVHEDGVILNIPFFKELMQISAFEKTVTIWWVNNWDPRILPIVH